MSQSLSAGQSADTGAYPAQAPAPLAPFGPQMRVTLRSSFIDVAGAHFLQALDEAGSTEQPTRIDHPLHKERVFMFPSDEYIRTIRVWGAFALGCGLIFGFAVEL